MAEDEESLSNVNTPFPANNSVTGGGELPKEVIETEVQCGFFTKLSDEKLIGSDGKNEEAVTGEQPAEGGEECGGGDKDEAVEKKLEVEVVIESNVGGSEEAVNNANGCSQAEKETVDRIRAVEGEVKAVERGGEMTGSNIDDLEFGLKGEKESVPVLGSEVVAGMVREERESSEAKADMETGLVIGDAEKTGKEEPAETEPIDFQTVEKDAIEYKENYILESNDLEARVADEVTGEEISTSKTEVDSVTRDEANDEVGNAGSGYQVHGFVDSTEIDRTDLPEAPEAVKSEFTEDKPVIAEDSLLAETEVEQEKDMNVDVLKVLELDEPVDIAQTVEETTAEEYSLVANAEMETEADPVVDVKGRNLDEGISSMDTKMAVGGELEIEKTNNDMGRFGQEFGDPLDAVHDEEDDAMVAEEDTGTQDTEMETEVDVADPGKVSGGKQKKGKKSKTPLSFKNASKASGKKLVGDDVCFICFDGGDLVMCDRRGCPKAYHPSCVNRDEAFFKAKGVWNCGWHFCSICEKNAYYKCYTCAFSLCKGCIKDAVILCIRGNKGFCETCMRTVMLIENNEQGNMDAEIDFDDKSSWEYLFKDYYMDLKSKHGLSSDEIAEAKNPWKGLNMAAGMTKRDSPEALVDTNDRGGSGSEAIEKPETRKSKRRKLKKQSKSPSKREEPGSAGVTAGDDCNSESDSTMWASKELLEFVSHMKNGDTSVLSQFDVQALLLEYINRNKLRDPRRKSQIICDARFENLFGKSRVGHFEMLKLIESHFLLKEDSPTDDVQGSVVDNESSQLDMDGNADTQTKGIKDRKRKTRKRGYSRAPQSNVADYAAIDMQNISLIYLRRKLMEDLLGDVDNFHNKVVGMFVRIRISVGFLKQDMYRLVQVTGTSKANEPYKIGRKTCDTMLEILNLNKTEIISIDSVSNQEFTEEECKRLRQSIKCGLISRLTVGDILEKAMEMQAARVNDWLESEILRLTHLRDRASDLGRNKELRECIEKLQILKTPEERLRRLEEIPEIHVDPKMNPNYESDNAGSETYESPRDAYLGSGGSSVSRRETGPISPGSDHSVIDSWSGAGKGLTKNWELSRNLSGRSISTDAIQNVEKVNENSWNQGRDRDTCAQEPTNLVKPSSTTNSETTQQNVRSVSGSEPVAAVSSLISSATISTRVIETSSAVTINETRKMWHYQDPSGKVQGPFSVVQLRKWSNAGYFPAELRIWRTGEKEEDSILLIDALTGKFQKQLPEIGDKLHASSGGTTKTSETSLNQDMKRSNAEQNLVQIPNLSMEKCAGNDSSTLTSTPSQSYAGWAGETDPLSGGTLHPSTDAVRTSLASTLPPLTTVSSSALNPSFASSHARKSEQGGIRSVDFCRTQKSPVPSEQHPVQMQRNLPATQDMTVQPVQSVSQDNQVGTCGSGSAPSQKLECNASMPESGQQQAHGCAGVTRTTQNSAINSSNSGATVMSQPEFWLPPTPSFQSNMQPSGMAGGLWAENPNPGGYNVQENSNAGWGNQAPGNVNMNWVPSQAHSTGHASSGWAAPVGNSGATVQGPGSGNGQPAWVGTPGWVVANGNTGSAVQCQGPVPGWGPPVGTGAPFQPLPAGIGAPVQGPPTPGIGAPIQGVLPPGMAPPIQATPPGVGAPVQGQPPTVGAPFQGPLPTGVGAPLQGPPYGNSNQGWIAPAGGQGMWGSQQNPNGGQFSGGFGSGRPWNGQSFGRGGTRPFNKRGKVCPYNINRRCKKGASCDYLHA